MTTVIETVPERDSEHTAGSVRLESMRRQQVVGVAELDGRSGRFLQANDRYCAMAGRTRGELSQLSWLDLLPAGDLPAGRARLAGQGADPAAVIDHGCRRGEGALSWHRSSLVPLEPTGVAGDEGGSPTPRLLFSIDVTAEKVAAAALGTSAARYGSLLDSIDAGFCILALKFDDAGRPTDYRFVETNPAFERQTGLVGVRGRWIRELVPDIERHWIDIYGRVALTGERIRFENFAAGLDNRWFDVNAFALEAERPSLVAALFNDITAKKQAEDILRQSEAQFRSFAQAMPNHVWTAPADGRLDWFNDRIFQYSGLSAAQLAGDGWTTMVHPDDVAGAARQWAAALQTGATYEVEFRLRRADGAFRWHLARAVPLRAADGAITRWVGTNTDIEDQKVLREQLMALNATLEQQVAERTRERDRIWNLIPDLLMSGTLDGQFLSLNPAWQEALGFDRATLLAAPYWDLVHPASLADGEAAVEQMRRGLNTRHQNRLRTASGDYRWFDWVATPSGDVFYAVARDITDLKNGQAALEAATEALRQSQKMEAIGQLTGGVAHDFNNLLQVISSNLQLIAHSVAGNARAEQRVASAQDAVRRGAKLAGQLLAFGRQQPLQPKSVNIARLVIGMEDMLTRALGEGVEIKTEAAGSLWNAAVDPVQMENALLNLAINARDAMDGHGQLTLEVGNADLDDAAARAEADAVAGQYVVLSVSDTGHGMSPEVMARAFEPFFTTKPVGSGTGLGLSMVYGFVRQSGGHVKVYSEVRRGTTVKLYLPRTREQEDLMTPVEAGLAAGGKETILVAEDDAAVRTAVVEMLTELGYRVLKAGDAASALTVIDSGVPVDLLFTDVVMPGPLKSTELARQAQQRLPRLAVLFTSGYPQDAIVHGGRLDEGVDLLQKPYTREALARKIRHLLGNAAQRALNPDAAAGAASAEAAVPPSNKAAGRAGVNVLLVEDDEQVRTSTGLLLRAMGHEVLESASAESALTLLHNVTIDVLIADVSLPGMPGPELTARARQIQPGIGVVYATGNRDQDTHLENGPPAVLVCKPYEPSNLKVALETVQLARGA